MWIGEKNEIAKIFISMSFDTRSVVGLRAKGEI
jgi:hypothetical protein